MSNSQANKKEKKRPERIKIPDEAPPPPQPPANLDDNVTMVLGGVSYDVRAQDLVRIKELGRGAYGIVETMKHVPSNTIMAVKRIHSSPSLDDKRLLIELNASAQSSRCPYMVYFYGAMFREGDVWICMEVMDTSLDKFYRTCVDSELDIPEPVLARIAFSVVTALNYMKEVLNLMHRDVKPSNILINRKGDVKICDFGISGHLTDSVAKTMQAGCKPYMAPERVDPQGPQSAYDIRSDVWSLGITLIEIATGIHPYAKWKTPFEQLKQVVYQAPPTLPADKGSPEMQDFIRVCLMKDYKERPKYAALLKHAFVVTGSQVPAATVAEFVELILSRNKANEDLLASSLSSLKMTTQLAAADPLPSTNNNSLVGDSSAIKAVASAASLVASDMSSSIISTSASGNSSADSEKVVSNIS